ncbi:MAG: hydrogenase iron-sulfur subunit [Armatimonadetes bacterium]|nr:hydrogenase iron-sulfur subunit [Armatimonadota bacterium]MDW8122330.1 hydrogenase iron-sulfur subunit [Armatimonadota bacterium]
MAAVRTDSERTEKGWEPKLIAFVCNWCTYAGADAAGTRRMLYSPCVRIIRFPCTGRIDPHFIVRAFEQGADGVLVSGCHPGDCHYVSGNLLARRRFAIFKALMDFLGLEPERLSFSWVSATEAGKWVEVVNSRVEALRKLGPARVPWGTLSGPPPSLNGRSVAPMPQEPLSQVKPDDYQAVESQLRQLAEGLLATGQVKAVLGYGKGSLQQATPIVITNATEANQLIFNEHCVQNLTVYLTSPSFRSLRPLGVVVKACDSKSLVGLLQEDQVKREDFRAIAVSCPGVKVNGRWADKCLSCDQRIGPIADHIVGSSEPKSTAGADPRDWEIQTIEKWAPAERWNFWMNQFSRCIRCYACRAVCPLCYCQPCIADKNRPQWIPTSPHLKGNVSWNLFRALHLAGRCIGCDECTRVCPVGIRLDLINRRLSLEVAKRFGYEPGKDPSVPPPLATYRPNDPGEFIL